VFNLLDDAHAVGGSGGKGKGNLDAKFLANLHQAFEKNDFYIKPRHHADVLFGIVHYAGQCLPIGAWAVPTQRRGYTRAMHRCILSDAPTWLPRPPHPRATGTASD
jgi:hypothetical protein